MTISEYVFTEGNINTIELVYYPDASTGYTLWFSSILKYESFCRELFLGIDIRQILDIALSPYEFSYNSYRTTGALIGVGLKDGSIVKIYGSLPNGTYFGVNLDSEYQIVESKLYNKNIHTGTIEKAVDGNVVNTYKKVNPDFYEEYKDSDAIEAYFSDKQRMYVLISKDSMLKYYNKIVKVINQ